MTFLQTPISGRYFSQDDRIEIADGLGRKEPVKSIAARIGKSYQSVYKEIARNRKPDGRYQPWYAHNQAYLHRRRPKVRVFVSDHALRDLVATKLAKRWSPAQISRWLRRKFSRRKRWHVCTETIYEALYRGLIVVADRATLRTGRTYRKRRGRGRSKDGSLRQCTTMRPIADRPVSVLTRRTAGHLEGDLIIGAMQRSAVATLVERRFRYTALVKIPGNHSAQVVADALIPALLQIPYPLRKTLTWDQGNEMFQHERIEQATDIPIYFADPHSPWQRPTNENTNGLIRQYLPKGTDLSPYSQEELDAIATELNQRPRACLGDDTPEHAMQRWLRKQQLPIRQDQ